MNYRYLHTATGYWAVQTDAGTGAYVAPTSAPTWTLYAVADFATATSIRNGTGTLVTGKAGRYVASDTLSTGNSYASGGRYFILWEWAIAGTNYGRIHYLEVV